ncbi:hypothetical protein GCM10009799_10120 [Nocardiopsis rhodophaea]|uniref:Uncharacterized protein n=1 Tax=Nocardiopsis rhodophaea TaxID=280238 RepID=A0ABN2SJ64_9ACTN
MTHPDHAAELARQRQEEARAEAERRRMLRDAERRSKKDRDAGDDPPAASFRPARTGTRERDVGPAA